MVEMTAEEQNKGKGMRRIEESLRYLWDNIKCTNIWIIAVPDYEKKKKKSTEKYFEEIVVENFPNIRKGNNQSDPRSAKHPLQVKPKEKYNKTNINQANRD